MMTSFESNILKEHLFDLWLWKCGLQEKNPYRKFDFDSLKKSEWSSEYEERFIYICKYYSQSFKMLDTFLEMQKNRLIMGAMRYGLLGDPNKPKWDRMGAIRKYLFNFLETGNGEMLVDVANFCLLEYVEGGGIDTYYKCYIKTSTILDFYVQVDTFIGDYQVFRNRNCLVFISLLVFLLFEEKRHVNFHLDTGDKDFHGDLKL